MPISNAGITSSDLSKNEYDLLGYLDSRAFIESAESRFTDWDDSFNEHHTDWQKRVLVQSELANCLKKSLIKLDYKSFFKESKIRIIFLGASLGSIATFFHLSILKELGLLSKLELYILDLLEEPLKRTKTGDFIFPESAAKSTGFSENFSISEYKSILAQSHIVQGNITNLPESLKDFDIIIAPYVQHHLNFYDKTIACSEMNKISKQNSLLLVGDLTFTYESFKVWLGHHASEKQPYALESFIPIEKHMEYFGKTDLIDSTVGEFYYSFCLKK